MFFFFFFGGGGGVGTTFKFRRVEAPTPNNCKIQPQLQNLPCSERA